MARSLAVGLFLPPAQFFPGLFVRGIGRYSAMRGPWHITIGLGAEPRYLKPFLRTCDGVIAYSHPSLALPLIKSGLPVVGYLSGDHMERFPLVLPDEQRIGELGAEHFLARGYRRFGFFGMRAEWSEGREAGFVRRLARAGFGCRIRFPPAPGAGEQNEHAFLRRWVKRLKPPAAIMAMNDAAAREIVDACQQIGWRVPEDIAVLGVDNDELLCNFSAIPLSSVDRDLERIGFETARLLERLINKEASPKERILVPPKPLVVRRSTEALAINDPIAAAAVRFIDEQACNGIDVDDVLAAVPVARRDLERKLVKAVGRTPAQEIRRVRLARVCELLTGTDLKLADIAARTGFQYRTHLSMSFKKAMGETPRKYRERNKSEVWK